MPRRRLGALIPFVMLLGPASVGPAPAAESESSGPARIRVSASVAPLASLAARIGGDRVEVRSLIPPGAAPDTYSPSPRQIEWASSARLHLLVGHPDFLFETTQMDRLLESATYDSILDLAALTDSRAGDDPHVWLAPSRMMPFMRAITERLVSVDPSHAGEFRLRLEELLAETRVVDDAIRSLTRSFGKDRSFLVQHPAWGWFAMDYDLVQIAIEQGGKEPGPRSLIPLIEAARSKGVRTVFVQQGFPRRHAELVAREIGANVEALDPLSPNWPANLLHAAERIAAAQPGEPGT